MDLTPISQPPSQKQLHAAAKSALPRYPPRLTRSVRRLYPDVMVPMPTDPLCEECHTVHHPEEVCRNIVTPVLVFRE